MHFRCGLAGLALVIACAPSVPRPPRASQPPDAGGDAAAPAPAAVFDAHGDSRPQPVPTVEDARGDLAGSDARAARVEDARIDLPADQGDGHDDDVVVAVDRPAGAMEPGVGELVIDELLINPAGTDTNREWIEVVNVASFALDLHALHVADAASDVALDAGFLAPGGILVLGQSLDPTKNGGAPISLSFGNTISLNNGGDTIALCLGPCAVGLVLDQIVWTADLGAAYDGHAAIVGPVAGRFCPAGEPFGTAGSFGSPGAPTPGCGDAGADPGTGAGTDAGTDARTDARTDAGTGAGAGEGGDAGAD